ncbi:PIG-X-domain-containing protein, partial [Hortaea werneckii]
ADAKNAALEKRLTAGLSELPSELRSIFASLHELHIRFVSRTPFHPTSPLVSPLPPGLHVSFTPRDPNAHVDLCPVLKQFFSPDLKCYSSTESFSSPPILSERFSSAAQYQYFYPLPRLIQFQTTLAKLVCETGGLKSSCVSEAAALSYASYLDIDFDVISHAVTLSGFWREGLSAEMAKSVPSKGSPNDSLEVGVLVAEKSDEPEELKLGGYLTVIGEDDEPNPTLFSFPSRHHPLPALSSSSESPLTYSTRFQNPTGLHPKLDITFSNTSLLAKPPKDDQSCALHAYLTLPSSLFIDRYQLSDNLYLQSQNLRRLIALSGEDDLEAPEWVVTRWGSAALFELAHPTPAEAEQAETWTASIPTHLRYLRAFSPNNATTLSHGKGQVELDIPWPTVFWACEASEGLKFAVNPFDRTNLGYDGLFGPKTMFYHVPPILPEEQQTRGLVEKFKAPVLEPEDAWWVQSATFVVVLVGFAWVLWKLYDGFRSAVGKEVQGEAKKSQ